MNKRIRKKKAKQQLIRAISGLVEAAEEMQREQERRTIQAGISYIKNMLFLGEVSGSPAVP